jgi:hypothetical protein
LQTITRTILLVVLYGVETRIWIPLVQCIFTFSAQGRGVTGLQAVELRKVRVQIKEKQFHIHSEFAEGASLLKISVADRFR